MGSKKAERKKAIAAQGAPPSPDKGAPPPPAAVGGLKAPSDKDAAQQRLPSGGKSDPRQATAGATPPPPAKPLSLKERLLPEGGLLPWWVGLIFSMYALLKLGMTLEHPCGVLGTWAPVSKTQISRAYRQLSVCTHPDKLVGHSPEDIRRGELLFKRASSAREELLHGLREAAAAEEAALAKGLPAPPDRTHSMCSTHLDETIVVGLTYIFGSLVETGLLAMIQSLLGFAWDLVTLQYEFSMTISFLLLGFTVYSALRQLLSFLVATGPITTIVSAVTTVIIGPIPTFYRFFATPPLRVLTFLRAELLPAISGAEADTDADADAAQIDAAAADEAPATPDPDAVDTHRSHGVAAVTANGALVPIMAVGSLSLVDVLRRKPQPHARAAAAAALQFDLLLSTTKYVLPLGALVATGQVFNGLWSSMATAQLLHKVPAMRAELHHVLLIIAGLSHTILCAGKSQLTEMSSDDLLQLQWSWSIRDVLTVANIMTLGAAFTSMSGAGNEPPFCASFAAGVAMRIVIYDWMPKGVASHLAATVRDNFQLELVGVDETAVRAAGGVGSCAGGVVRATLGWLESPSVLPLSAIALKAALLLLPSLAAMQWALRCLLLVRRLKREHERERPRRLAGSKELLVPVLRRRLALSVLIAGSMVTLVTHFVTFELNAVNSSLGSFLVVALAGCLFESLLCTYDVRGRVRQVVFFLVFMVL